MARSLTLSLNAEPSGATIRSLGELNLIAEFKNRGARPVSVLIDVTPLPNGGYDLEFTDEKGRPVRPDAVGMCGTVSPLQEHEISLVEPGAAFRTPIRADHIVLEPGSYRVRVTYEAHDSPRDEQPSSDAVATRLNHLWTGTLQSNWLPLTLHP